MLTDKEYKLLRSLVDKIGRGRTEKPIIQEVKISELVRRFYEVPVNPKGTHVAFLSATDIQEFITRKAKLTIGSKSIAIAMREAGYAYEIRRVDGKSKRGYPVIVKREAK